ncbi:hypothetical protein F0562_012066 [Nyssa sinensis]|uniref:C2H2-type domain-containing protein n=1 Tax=Nyssa sinensis TaxID=561372 RepID=A0A5J4ZVD5_9ASTE|nr:hypothetical protein F0562_012066 [Nyssa sinensis]
MVENIDRIMHYCKICKRGFVCGGALGGHMRAHAAGDVNVGIDHEEHPMSNFMGKPEGKKCTYFLRANAANRFMSFRAREDCDKKFLTLNSFSPDERVSPMSSPGSEVENEDLANCLVMLSNGKLDPMVAMINNSFSFARKDDEEDKAKEEEVMMKGIFQCKACKKVFNSHQALGGHRASHKKVKGCFAARFHDNLNGDTVEDQDIINHDQFSTPAESDHPPLDLNHTLEDAPFGTHLKKKSTVHECSICHRVFSSGQALGGHKRCHWLASNLPDTSSTPKLHEFQYNSQQFYEKPMFKKSKPLDLNQFPALLDDTSHKAHPNGENTLKFEVPTRIYLLPRASEDNDNQNQNRHQHITSNMHGSLHEEDGKRKLVKLRNLRDMNLDGGSSTWLQVGIAPTT